MKGVDRAQFKADRDHVKEEFKNERLPTDQRIDQAFDEAEVEISQIVDDGLMLSRFRGKQILKIFHNQYAGRAKPFQSLRAFETKLAEIIAKREEGVVLNDFVLSVINR